MGTRSDVADALAAAFVDDEDAPTAKVVGSLDAISPEPFMPVVAVGLDSVTPGRVANARLRTGSFTIIAAIAQQTPGTADDALEDLLGEVLDVLDGHPWANWTSAERATWLDEAFPAYKITVEITGEVATT